MGEYYYYQVKRIWLKIIAELSMAKVCHYDDKR